MTVFNCVRSLGRLDNPPKPKEPKPKISELSSISMKAWKFRIAVKHAETNGFV